MPRYYFHLHDHGSKLGDEQGMALPDAEAAWYQAIRSARELIKADLRLGCSWDAQTMEIEDDQGTAVCQVPLQEVARFSV
jgi:hypothetical protein